ncbi:hypothetical protein C5S29_12240 [ANME-1 cluster archaeon GoMg3.2]|nr:hypothetical protein [ANME-1 cluster archaeon GoMg3.2]
MGKRKLVEAETLLQQGNATTAILKASIYLEQALRKLVYQNKSGIADLLQGRKPERLSMGQMLGYLSKLDVISKDDVPKIQECVDLRNRTAHSLAEPTIADAKSFIEVASDFIEKYLEKDFNGG